MYLISTETAENYLARFEDCTLAAEDWTHEMHLIVGMGYLLKYGKQALPLMRNGIKNFNLALGKQNTDTGGYHDTMTVFWLWRLQQFCTENSITTFDEVAVDTLLYAEIMAERNAFLQYYSLDVMMSVAARRSFVASNLQPMVGIDFFEL